jgi:hypothetical protein
MYACSLGQDWWWSFRLFPITCWLGEDTKQAGFLVEAKLHEAFLEARHLIPRSSITTFDFFIRKNNCPTIFAQAFVTMISALLILTVSIIWIAARSTLTKVHNWFRCEQLAGHSFGTEAGQELVQISGVTQPHAPFAYASNTAPPHTPVSLDERAAEDRALKLDAEAHVAHPLSSDNPESSRRVSFSCF